MTHSFVSLCFVDPAGHQFRAHKAVLAACSQFFHKFFQDFTQEPLVEIEGTWSYLTVNTAGGQSFIDEA